MPIITGIQYPLAYDGNGNISLSSDIDLKGQAILSWLESFRGERVELDYGVRLYVGSAQYYPSIEGEIVSELKREIPGIIFNIKVTVIDDGELIIDVYWQPQDSEKINNVRTYQNV